MGWLRARLARRRYRHARSRYRTEQRETRRRRDYWEEGRRDHRTPPIAGDDAARGLAANERWPEPTGLLGWRRRLFGRPPTTGSDELSMRADTYRIAESIGKSSNPLPTPHPGLTNLVSRSERRCIERSAKPCRRLTRTLGRTTAAQSALDSADYERNAAASDIVNMPEQLPRPRLGVALTRNRSVWVLLCVVIIPLESYLTYRQLLVLGMSNTTTRTLSILIGLSLIVVAEVVGLLLYYLMTHPDEQQGSSRWRQLGAQYWVVVALTVVTVGTGVVTLHRLAVAREHNQQLLDQREQHLHETAVALKTNGYLKPKALGTNGATNSISAQETKESGHVDLAWTFWLQLLAFLGAVGISVRKRDADDYNERERERSDRLKRARLAERRLQRHNRRVTSATSRHEAVLREIRAIHEHERALLRELFARVRTHALDMDPALIPELKDIEDAIRRTVAPHLESIGQPTVSRVPVPQPPPPPQPMMWPPPQAIHSDRSREHSDSGNAPPFWLPYWPPYWQAAEADPTAGGEQEPQSATNGGTHTPPPRKSPTGKRERDWENGAGGDQTREGEPVQPVGNEDVPGPQRPAEPSSPPTTTPSDPQRSEFDGRPTRSEPGEVTPQKTPTKSPDPRRADAGSELSPLVRLEHEVPATSRIEPDVPSPRPRIIPTTLGAQGSEHPDNPLLDAVGRIYRAIDRS